MSDFTFRLAPELLQQAVFDPRWSAIARAGTDLGTLTTWDRSVPRDPRVLVPVDVQAFVVPASGGEPTVRVAGLPEDPEPFADGELRAPGVHLHWAVPDALLRGAAAADGSLALPVLPDRWVVVRTLRPVGGRRALVHGWVVDSPTGAVTRLADFDGEHAADQPAMPLVDPLDAGRGGGPLWTASATASERRFALHDPLDDLEALREVAPRGLESSAGYVVAGWWTDPDQDPVTGARGPVALDAVLGGLGWFVEHDGTADVDPTPPPQLQRLHEQLGYVREKADPQVSVVTDGRVERWTHAAVAPTSSLPLERVSEVLVGAGLPRYSCLLHGAVVGVPVDGALPAADDRPPRDAVGIAVGLDVDDVVAAFGAAGLDLGEAGREAAEQLLAAFAGGLLDRYVTADGLSDLLEREHSSGFWALPGTPLPMSAPDRLRVQDAVRTGPTTVGRKGRAGTPRPGADGPPGGAAPRPGRGPAGTLGVDQLATKVVWQGSSVLGLARAAGGAPPSPTVSEAVRRPEPGESREVVRAAPRLFRPQAPLVGLRGAKPSHRHHDDGLFHERGLQCRYAAQCVTAVSGVVDGASVVPTLGSGAVPAEVLDVVREAVLIDPYAHRWLAAAGSEPSGAVTTRLAGEAARLFGTDGTYDPTGRTALRAASTGPRAPGVGTWSAVSRVPAAELAVASEVARHSLLVGTPPSPVALTTWRQPWVPLWLEWEVEVVGSSSLAGWRLDALDLEPDPAAPPAQDLRRVLVGRSPVNEGVGTVLQGAVRDFLDGEQQREVTRASLADADADLLADLATYLHQLDLVSASLDGLREQLLGIDYVGQVLRQVGEDGVARPVADQPPVPLFGGRMTVRNARLVDAFGRVLDVPVGTAVTTTTLAVPDVSGAVRLRPRVQHGARWLFRLVDPGHPTSADPALAAEAFVDQLNPHLAVNPVAGFLLPDHVDEALEAFDVAGTPLGQLLHEPTTGGVTWETAPGRPLPSDSGPLDDLDPRTALVGRVAAGVVQADVEARASGRPGASALTALLRAVDTVLWTVDTYAAVGGAAVASLVGRPIAVVRATLRLELPDDVDELVVTAPDGPQAREQVFAALAEERFPVRLGELTRSDDALLGFYVDDDYRHLHLVDRVVASEALEGGRHRGHLGLLGSAPEPEELHHDYLVAEDELWLRPGRTTRLTLLMLPAGSVHLTSGVLPRKALALAEDWVTAGLARLVPSMRVGPVLVDPGEVRLPLAHHLGESQAFTRRTGPLTWRDDPILAASQAALLPRMPHEVQEGWVRVMPTDPAGGGGS